MLRPANTETNINFMCLIEPENSAKIQIFCYRISIGKVKVKGKGKGKAEGFAS
jgi:environmental stress-induced protein Ves